MGRLFDARSFDRLEAPARRTLVRERLQPFLAHCVAESRHYGDLRSQIEPLLSELDDARFFEGFAALPPLTKDTLVRDFERVVTDPEITLARVQGFDGEHTDGLGVLETARGAHQVLKTSGTSGTLVYIVDRVDTIKQVMSLLLYRALVRVLVTARMWPVLLPLMRPWYRFFRRVLRGAPVAHGAPGSAPVPPRAPGLLERVTRFFRPSILVFVHRGNRSVYRGTTSHSQPLWARLLLHVRVLSHEESLESILAGAAWQQPEFMFGLPSRIEWLARAQLEGRLAIDPVAVHVGGETLHAELLDLFRKAWPRSVVINTYGATETKAIATACGECGELHVLEDIVHLELYGEGGRPLEEGEFAHEVYCTGMWNRVTPVVRYAMTDRIQLLGDIGCAWRTRRIRVAGREPAFVWAQHQHTGAWVPLNARMLKESLVGLPDVLGFRVRYAEVGRLELTLVVSREGGEAALREAASRAVAELTRDQGSAVTELLPRVEIHVVSAEHFNREGGKLNAISATVLPPDLQSSVPESRPAS